MATTAIQRVPQGYLSPKVTFLSASLGIDSGESIAIGTDDVLARWVLPCDCRILKADYVITTTGSGNVNHLKLKDGSTAISPADETPDTGTQTKLTGSIIPTTRGQEYAVGTVIDFVVTGTTDATVFVDCCFVLTIQPAGGA